MTNNHSSEQDVRRYSVNGELVETVAYENEVARLLEVIGKMVGLAGAGVCNFGATAKHGFHQDILDIGKKEGFNILGMPTEKLEEPLAPKCSTCGDNGIIMDGGNLNDCPDCNTGEVN